MRTDDRALEKAVDYILNSSEDYCTDICPNLKECNEYCATYGDNAPIDLQNCKANLIKHFKGE